jgi:subtilase family serine protease
LTAQEELVLLRDQEELIVKQQKQRFLYFILCFASVLVILVGIFASTFLLRPRVAAQAARRGQPRGIQASVLPMHPMYKMAVPMGTGNGSLPCLTNPGPPLCYSPQQIRQAYGIAPLLHAGITGKGRIITIIDVFQDPTVRTDLRLFDRLFGLNDPQLNILAPFGLTPFNPQDPAQTGFAGEIALDVEWAHAVAPDATIDLVLGHVQNGSPRGQLAALLQATGYAVRHSLGSVISQSFGAGEACLSPAFIQAEHQIFQTARVQRQTVFASAGDTGAAVLQCDAQGNPVALARGVNYPASDPLVTSVGGTTLFAAQSGAYLKETAWNESQNAAGATGGGVSRLFSLPPYQAQLVNSNGRSAADLSLDADPLTSVPVVTSSLMPGKTMIVPIGGTSVGSPVMAGMVALFDQARGERLGFLNSAFYRLGQSAAYIQAFHDVQAGTNTFVFQQRNGNIVAVPGFRAGQGWDPPTGLGTPNAAELAGLLPGFITPNDGAGL